MCLFFFVLLLHGSTSLSLDDTEKNIVRPVKNQTGANDELTNLLKVKSNQDVIGQAKNFMTRSNPELFYMAYSHQNELALTRGHLAHTFSVFPTRYSVSFDLKATDFLTGWHSVIHLTTGGNHGQYGDRIPAVWLHTNGDGRLHITSAVNNQVNYVFDTQPITENSWTHVEIRQIQNNNQILYQIVINGQVVHSVTNQNPTEFYNVKMYTSDPWHESQSGAIRNLEVILAKAYFQGNEFALTKGHLAATFPVFPTRYSVSFDLKATDFVTGWHSVIHLTTGGNHGQYGDRIPAVWLHTNGDGRLHITSAVNNQVNYVFDTQPITKNSWTHVEIRQIQDDDNILYQIVINGEVVHSVINQNPTEFRTVKMYTSDPWHDTQPGVVENLEIILGEKAQLASGFYKAYSNPNELALARGHLAHTFSVFPTRYSVSFDLMATDFLTGWHSVIHLTTGGNHGQYGDRIPAVWLHTNGNGRLHITSAVNNQVNYVFDTQPIIDNQVWTHVEIRQIQEDDNILYQVIINGQVVHSVINQNPTEFYNVRMYTSDPWHESQPGCIRNLEVILAKAYSSESEFALTKDHLAATFPVFPTRYSVSFDLKATEFLTGWHSVIHLTTGGNHGQYGDRIPAVWLHTNGNGRLHTTSAVNNQVNYVFDTQPITENSWTHVEIRQIQDHDNILYQIVINGQVVHSVINQNPTVFHTVKMYTSDPWHDSQPGAIKNLEVIFLD